MIKLETIDQRGLFTVVLLYSEDGRQTTFAAAVRGIRSKKLKNFLLE